MPGAYAHLTIVNEARDTDRLESAGVPIPAIQAVLKYLRFCELGAVSPDYPYLDLMDGGSKRWADLMHYERTSAPIQRGIELVRALRGEERLMASAWLMGYAAHVATDVTIHPVIELLVGKYAENATAHRICELNQDAYIFRRMNLDDVGRSEHLDSGIWGCCDTPDSGVLHPTITLMWRQMLSSCYPKEYADNEPDIDAWHRGFKRVVDLAEEGRRMPLFARHLAVSSGLTYPASGHVDMKFISNLKTPHGYMHYDDLFDKAVAHVDAMWSLIGRAIFESDDSYRTQFRDYDLDTGKDAQGSYAYWPHATPANSGRTA
jgi:hypothetical protein